MICFIRPPSTRAMPGRNLRQQLRPTAVISAAVEGPVPQLPAVSNMQQCKYKNARNSAIVAETIEASASASMGVADMHSRVSAISMAERVRHASHGRSIAGVTARVVGKPTRRGWLQKLTLFLQGLLTPTAPWAFLSCCLIHRASSARVPTAPMVAS
jgi:hypothetical protein